MSKLLASGIILGIGIGTYIPSLPYPIKFINNYIGIILIIIGLIMLITSK